MMKEMGKVAWSRKLKVAVAVLVVAVPIGLLSILQIMRAELVELEPIVVEPVSWQMYRPKLDPDHSLIINETVKNGYSDNYTSMEINLHLYHYLENWDELPFGKPIDGIIFRVNVTATVTEGFDAVFAVRFRTVDNFSVIYVSRQYLVAYNASVTEMRLVSRDLGEAYVKAESTGSRCSLRDQIEWVFTDLNVENHQLEVTFEFTYFNQTTSQKIVVPIILDMPLSTQNGG